jgi:hypothetical protein
VERLDDNCGINGWSIAPAGVRGVVNDAIAVYVSNPTCAAASLIVCAERVSD